MVRTGYQQTEVGEIPGDWDVQTISEVAEVKGGKRLPKGRGLLENSNEYPYIRVADMYMGGVLLASIKYVPEDVAPIIKGYRISSNDLFISVAGTLGVVGEIPSELDGANLTENANKITNISCSKQYLLYWLMNERIQNEIATQSTVGAQPKLALGRIEGFKIALPSKLDEQESIAKALSDVDEFIVSLEKLIAKKRDIKTATMQQLLTGKLRLPGFGEGKGYKQTELSEIPEDWGVKELGHVVKIEMGRSPSSSNYNTKGFGLPLIQGNADVHNRKTILRNYTSQITKKAQIGDIILSVRAPVGEVSIAEFDCCIGRGVCAISYKNDYLYHWLVSFESSWEKYSKGSTFDSINSDELKDIKILLPYDENEQIEIASVLSGIDKEIAAVDSQLEKTKSIKQGMMQELLTGRTRLVDAAGTSKTKVA